MPQILVQADRVSIRVQAAPTEHPLNFWRGTLGSKSRLPGRRLPMARPPDETVRQGAYLFAQCAPSKFCGRPSLTKRITGGILSVYCVY